MQVGIFCSPRSFLAGDILIDLISAIIVFAIAVYAFRLYRRKNPFEKCKNLALFGVALLSLGFSFVIKLLTYFNLVLSGDDDVFRKVVMHAGDLEGFLFMCGFFSYRLLTVIGFFIIYCIAFKKDSFLSKVLVFLLLFVNTIMLRYYFSQTFYLTNALLLLVISLKYRGQYMQTKQKNTRFVALSFALLSASYLIVMISEWFTMMYIVSRLIWLVSFIILLWSFLQIQHGKKKKTH